MRPKKIIVVDDERIILLSLKHQIMSYFENNVDLNLFDNPIEVIEFLQNENFESIDMLISNYMMPGMIGPELIRKVDKLIPNATRILMSGFCDQDEVKKLIDEKLIYCFISKPWGDVEFKRIFDEVFRKNNAKNSYT